MSSKSGKSVARSCLLYAVGFAILCTVIRLISINYISNAREDRLWVVNHLLKDRKEYIWEPVLVEEALHAAARGSLDVFSDLGEGWLRQQRWLMKGGWWRWGSGSTLLELRRRPLDVDYYIQKNGSPTRSHLPRFLHGKKIVAARVITDARLPLNGVTESVRHLTYVAKMEDFGGPRQEFTDIWFLHRPLNITTYQSLVGILALRTAEEHIAAGRSNFGTTQPLPTHVVTVPLNINMLRRAKYAVNYVQDSVGQLHTALTEASALSPQWVVFISAPHLGHGFMTDESRSRISKILSSLDKRIKFALIPSYKLLKSHNRDWMNSRTMLSNAVPHVTRYLPHFAIRPSEVEIVARLQIRYGNNPTRVELINHILAEHLNHTNCVEAACIPERHRWAHPDQYPWEKGICHTQPNYVDEANLGHRCGLVYHLASEPDTNLIQLAMGDIRRTDNELPTVNFSSRNELLKVADRTLELHAAEILRVDTHY